MGNDWVLWNGDGDCPTDRKAKVELTLGSGTIITWEPHCQPAGDFRWKWDYGGLKDDIVAYKLWSPYLSAHGMDTIAALLEMKP